MNSRAYQKGYDQIDWSDLRPVPNRPRVIKDRAAFHIIKDIEPYRSMITSEIIGGRRQHREHLLRHEVIEVGNERLKPRKPDPMPDARLDIAQVMREKGYIG